jgi:hypothetical protein
VRLALPGAPAAAEPQIVGEGCAEVRGDGV